MDESSCNQLQVIPATYNMQKHVISIHQSLKKKELEDKDETINVKSSAVDLHSTVKSPAKFFKLQNNTDLNMRPANWLSGPKPILGLRTRDITHHPLPSSFRMAGAFLDCVGHVDVVSDAENIKKLLKIPYSKGTVSMMVHRVGNTLLLVSYLQQTLLANR